MMLKLKPYLIEVNISPDMVGSSPMDQKIKGAVIPSTLICAAPGDTDLRRSTGVGSASSRGRADADLKRKGDAQTHGACFWPCFVSPFFTSFC